MYVVVWLNLVSVNDLYLAKTIRLNAIPNLCRSRNVIVYAITCDAQINGMAYDWSSGNVYWTDGEFHLIGALASYENGKHWKPVVTTDLTSPQDIVVDPTHRYMYVCYLSETNMTLYPEKKVTLYFRL